MTALVTSSTAQFATINHPRRLFLVKPSKLLKMECLRTSLEALVPEFALMASLWMRQLMHRTSTARNVKLHALLAKVPQTSA